MTLDEEQEFEIQTVLMQRHDDLVKLCAGMVGESSTGRMSLSPASIVSRAFGVLDELERMEKKEEKRYRAANQLKAPHDGRGPG